MNYGKKKVIKVIKKSQLVHFDKRMFLEMDFKFGEKILDHFQSPLVVKLFLGCAADIKRIKKLSL